jgi:branched-chain amino acid transport system substrate-binding protein
MVSSDDPTQLRRRFLQATGLTLLGGLAGCASDGTENGGETETTTESSDVTTTEATSMDYTIGMVDSLTGSLSDFGERNQRGKDMALDAVNEVGLDGGELSIVVEDSESTSQSGVSAAQKLVNQNEVPFIIGAVGSGVSLSIYDSVIQGTDVVQLSQNSTGLGLTEKPGLLRISPSGRSQAIALTDIIAEDGYDSVALTWVNNNYGQSLADSFRNNWDGEVAFKNPHNQGEASYTNLISQMADSGADAWVFIAYQQGFTTMVNDIYSGGYDPALYGADSVRGESVLEGTPDGSMEGLKIVTPSAPVNQDRYKEFAANFQDRYDKEPTSWAAYAYDAVITAALSIMAAEEFTGAALGEVVRDVTRPEGTAVTTFEEGAQILADGGGPSDVDYQGVSGPIDFDENGDPKGFLQVLEVQDHSYKGIDFISG